MIPESIIQPIPSFCRYWGPTVFHGKFWWYSTKQYLCHSACLPFTGRRALHRKWLYVSSKTLTHFTKGKCTMLIEGIKTRPKMSFSTASLNKCDIFSSALRWAGVCWEMAQETVFHKGTWGGPRSKKLSVLPTTEKSTRCVQPKSQRKGGERAGGGSWRDNKNQARVVHFTLKSMWKTLCDGTTSSYFHVHKSLFAPGKLDWQRNKTK